YKIYYILDAITGCYSDINLFFFSSRRRHTRSKRDWSSDVCSSDLEVVGVVFVQNAAHHIVGAAGGGIAGETGDHAAHLAAGEHFVGHPHRQGVGQQLVVGALENSLVIVGFLVLDQTAAVPGIEPGSVDLVE